MHPAKPDAAALDAAFDHAVRQVDRALAAGMRTLTGEPAAPRLERLRADLVTQREAARRLGSTDPDWVRDAIRRVADWAPETDVTLLAALGALARLRSDAPAG